MNLNEVHRGLPKRKARRRIGRGPGSGHGKTAGRGHNGQGSRSGARVSPIFQGGSTPLVRRIPKRGFNNRWADVIAVVNLSDLEESFSVGEAVTPDALKAKNLAKGRYDMVKILGNGEIKKKLRVEAHRFSKSAIEKIEKAGGEVVVLPGKTTVAEKQKLARSKKADAAKK